MQYHFLGKTGIRVSALGFGTMSFGNIADEDTSATLFHRCREVGINLFDCANVYADGRSEEILGRLVQDCRDEVILTTKAYFPTGEGPNARGSSRWHLMQAVEESLRRLDTNYIDLFFLHRFDEETALWETLRTLDDLVRQGKVRYIGASNFAAWQVARALGLSEREGWVRFCCIQPMYNLVKRQAEVELLPMAQAEHLGVLPYSPLGGGLLTGKYGTDRRPETGRLVENEMYQTRYGQDWVYEVAERFSGLAREQGVPPAALAVAWTAAHPAVTAPLLGARTCEQLDESLAALEIDMTPSLYEEIASCSPAPPPATDRIEERSEHTYGTR